MDRPGAPRCPRQPTAAIITEWRYHQATARRFRRRPDRGARRGSVVSPLRAAARRDRGDGGGAIAVTGISRSRHCVVRAAGVTSHTRYARCVRCRAPLAHCVRGMTCSGVRQRPTVRDAQPGIIDAALHRSRPVAPVGTGLRLLPATTSVPTARSAPASAERRSSLARQRASGCMSGRACARTRALTCRRAPWIAAPSSVRGTDCGRRATGNSGGHPCPLTTTVYWRGCGWTPWAAKHRWTFRLFRSGPPAAAARRHPAGRGLRARRHHRQPARPLARRGVTPLLIHAP